MYLLLNVLHRFYVICAIFEVLLGKTDYHGTNVQSKFSVTFRLSIIVSSHLHIRQTSHFNKKKKNSFNTGHP